MGVQGRRNLVKTGWARPQILTTSTIGISKLDEFCNLDGFFASDLKKTGWANAYPAHPVLPLLENEWVSKGVIFHLEVLKIA